jgi:hypothetical protein
VKGRQGKMRRIVLDYQLKTPCEWRQGTRRPSYMTLGECRHEARVVDACVTGPLGLDEWKTEYGICLTCLAKKKMVERDVRQGRE